MATRQQTRSSGQQTRTPEPTVPVTEAPSKNTARDLAVAERTLSELDDAYLEAKHAWLEAMRASGRGTGTAAAVTEAQDAMERADEERRGERERIDALRHRLHDQRRREILMQAVSGQDVARTEVRRHVAEKDSHRSLLSRLFGRRSD